MKKLRPEDWMSEIDNGLKFREIFGREASWKQLEMDYLNGAESHTALGANLVFSMGDSLLSSLNVPNPEITVSAEHPSGVDRAPIVESWDNYLIRKLKLKNEALRSSLQMKLCVLHFMHFFMVELFGNLDMIVSLVIIRFMTLEQQLDHQV